MKKKEVILFYTDDCHLCEQALEQLNNCQAIGKLSLEKVDIALNDSLFERYGTRIPVLYCSSKELDWPFNTDEISEFLRSSLLSSVTKGDK